MEPLNRAPSARITRGAQISPFIEPVAATSTLSVAVMLPTTSPVTFTDFAVISADRRPLAPTVRW